MIKKPFQFPSLMLALLLSIGLLVPTTWAAAAMKADINAASMAELEAVTGVGHDTAQNILDYKKEHGKYKTMNDLEVVKGVGKVRLQALNEVFMVGTTKKGTKK